MNQNLVGLGSEHANLYFYIKNRPPTASYQELSSLKKVTIGEIAHIGNETGNHWRKIFNVYAKLMFELAPDKFTSWQSLRDEQLLQETKHCLLFSKPQLSNAQSNKVHIILGKGYAEQLGLVKECHWLNNDFAINQEQQMIISPYFDYRQLSNIKITQLSRLITQLQEAQ